MRHKTLDLNLLVALDILLEEQSVTRAAERLHISQPAMSAALARLRDYFDEPLFVMHGKKMVPTATALRLKEPLKTLLRDVDVLVTEATHFDPATSERHFKVSASDYVLAVVMPHLIQRLEHLAPGIIINCVPQSELSAQQLDQGKLDMIIAPEKHISPDHPSELLFTDRFMAVGCAGNPLMAVDQLTEEAFYAAGHVVVDIGANSAPSVGESHLRQRGRQRRIEMSVASFLLAPEMVVNTAKITVMHEKLARLFQQRLPIAIAELPFDLPCMREMVQYHVSRQNDTGLRWLIDQMRQLHTLNDK
ncbi:LysR family transcriptional regulator [Aestuariicella hydrocarbonica]|uniref:LysR family transcriptional regulator n=1 Tax=Pseudomaricurvus hydrocarbonicus TaxID=1470433 RepID=A0A9E5T1F2_9GAMM|nr:LysR family transcriptional regulator [Aestuariicella hydrocarbonica]